jgi:hypothetical protein
MYISIFYVLTHKRKKYHKKAYFSIEFCYFYIGHMKIVFFLKTTSWARRTWITQHFNLKLLNFLSINCIISNKGNICIRGQKDMSGCAIFEQNLTYEYTV